MGMFGEFLLPLGSCWGGNGNSHDRKKKTLLSLSKSCQCPRFLVLPSDGSFDSEVCLCIQCDTRLHDQIRRDKLLIAAVGSTKKKQTAFSAPFFRTTLGCCQHQHQHHQ
jgi:hypothetical protein